MSQRRHTPIAESTWARWLARYGGTKAGDAKRLEELLLEAELDKSMLEEW